MRSRRAPPPIAVPNSAPFSLSGRNSSEEVASSVRESCCCCCYCRESFRSSPGSRGAALPMGSPRTDLFSLSIWYRWYWYSADRYALIIYLLRALHGPTSLLGLQQSTLTALFSIRWSSRDIHYCTLKVSLPNNAYNTEMHNSLREY